jgi:hypothetical protein
MKYQPLKKKSVISLILLALLFSLEINRTAQADPIIDVVFDLDGVFLEVPSKPEKDRIPEFVKDRPLWGFSYAVKLPIGSDIGIRQIGFK